MLYDVISKGSYDSSGVRHSAPHINGFGSLTYVNYGLANKFTVGLIPVFGYNQVSQGLDSSGIGAGDLTVQAQYRLHLFHEGSWVPTTSFALQETFPTGKYDSLGIRASAGIGSGLTPPPYASIRRRSSGCRTDEFCARASTLRKRFRGRRGGKTSASTAPPRDFVATPTQERRSSST